VVRMMSTGPKAMMLCQEDPAVVGGGGTFVAVVATDLSFGVLLAFWDCKQRGFSTMG